MIAKVIKSLITFWKAKSNRLKIGGGNYINMNVKFVNRGTIILGNDVTVRPSTCVYANNGRSIVSFGNHTEIGNHSTISSHVEVVLEDGVLTGPHVFISDHNHEYRNPDIPVYKQGVMSAGGSKVVIGEGSWLGTNVVVVGNVRVGKHCVIGANSVVTKDIPDYSVAAGIPCKVIKQYDFGKNEWVKV